MPEHEGAKSLSSAMKSLLSRFDRVDIATYVGALLWVAMLESHYLPRPLVFFIGPFAILACFYFLVPSVSRERWQSVISLAAVASILGYLLTRFVFTHP